MRPGRTWQPPSRCRRTRPRRWVAASDLLAAADGSSLVELDFDATVAWPTYDWMGLAKAGLEATSRYLGNEVNLVAAGPLQTISQERAPLAWDSADPEPSPAPCASCSRTGPQASPARSSTSTAGPRHRSRVPVRRACPPWPRPPRAHRSLWLPTSSERPSARRNTRRSRVPPATGRAAYRGVAGHTGGRAGRRPRVRVPGDTPSRPVDPEECFRA
jgi:hypothetical protein